jgi:hypothetical protein
MRLWLVLKNNEFHKMRLPNQSLKPIVAPRAAPAYLFVVHINNKIF